LDSTSLITTCGLPVQVTVNDPVSPQSPSLTASVSVTVPAVVQVNVGLGAPALLSVPALAVQR